MAVNDLVVNQASTILVDLVKQATGVDVIRPSTPGEFVSVAQTALKTGYDPILNAMSQMWGRTIFSIRPYSRLFGGMEMSMDRWGNATRKISIADKPVVDDDRFKYPVSYDGTQTPPNGDGGTVDMYTINKPDVLQTNFYGQSVYENFYTIFRDNLDTAFSGPEDFMRFNGMVAQNRADKLEQYRETIARGLLCNMIGAILDENNYTRVIHLITDYNAASGQNLDAQSVYQPTNFAPFMRWVYARIKTLSRMMRERSVMFQTIVNNKEIMRHTPAERQKIYLFAPAMDQFSAMVASDTYHDNLLRFADYEGVTYWQSIDEPSAVNVTPVYTHTDGTVKTAQVSVNVSDIFGVIFDEDALGYAQVTAWSSLTPFNAKGGYWNDYDHVNFRTLMDMSEKALVLLLD